MENTVSRAKQYIDSKGISVKKFEESVGFSNGAFASQYKNGKTIGVDKVENILSTYPDISPDWLLTGNGPMLRDDERGSALQPLSKDTQGRVAVAISSDEGIPLIPLDAMAGFCAGNSAQVMEYECEKYVVPSFRGADFLISVRGDSMEPKYSSGDIVACKSLPLDTFFQWNKVYVVDTEQGVLIKRMRKWDDDDHVLMVSENEQYEPFTLHRSDIRTLAIVIGVIRLE